ncbi:hypothetical protein K3495_g11014 [Podosphaera aphanis]|nr:hypothetical protein K3495_g11014 [Podosphaera aphanis]
MPKLSSNHADCVQGGAGLRYRSIENSNWRGATRKQELNEEDLKSEGRRMGDKHKKDEVEYNFEEFTGTEFREAENRPLYCMSVMLGTGSEVEKNRMRKSREKRVRFGGSEEKKPVSLDAYLNIGDGKKRARPYEWETILNKEEKEPKIRRREKQKEKVTRQLREIIGRQGKGPLDYKRLAEHIKVELSLMDLFQVSPDLSKAFKALSTRVTAKTSKEKKLRSTEPYAREAQMKETLNEYSSETLLGKAVGLHLTADQKAYRIPVTVRTIRQGKPVRISIPIGAAQADQGSEMIIVTLGFLKKLGLPIRSLAGRGFNGLSMNLADGTSAQLTYHSEFEI